MSIWLRSFHPFLCANFHVQLYLFRLPHTYSKTRTLALPTQNLIGQEYSIMIWFLFELTDRDICALGANSTGIDLGATQREE